MTLRIEVTSKFCCLAISYRLERLIFDNVVFKCVCFIFNRYPFQAMEIFQCEINPLLEKFFEAPEPKKPQTENSAANKDMDDGEVLTDDLGAAVSDDKYNDLDFDNVFNVKTTSNSNDNDGEDKKVENTFSFDTPAASTEETKEDESAATTEATDTAKDE